MRPREKRNRGGAPTWGSIATPPHRWAVQRNCCSTRRHRFVRGAVAGTTRPGGTRAARRAWTSEGRSPREGSRTTFPLFHGPQATEDRRDSPTRQSDAPITRMTLRSRASPSGDHRASTRKRVPNTRSTGVPTPGVHDRCGGIERSPIHGSIPPRAARFPVGPTGRHPGLPTARRGGHDVSMAVVMSEMPDVWRRVLAEHVPDAQGNCRECFHAGGRASWPCQTYRIAEEAKWVAEGGLPGTGPHGPGPSRTRLSPPEPQAARRDDPLEDPLGSIDARGLDPVPRDRGLALAVDRLLVAALADRREHAGRPSSVRGRPAGLRTDAGRPGRGHRRAPLRLDVRRALRRLVRHRRPAPRRALVSTPGASPARRQEGPRSAPSRAGDAGRSGPDWTRVGKLRGLVSCLDSLAALPQAHRLRTGHSTAFEQLADGHLTSPVVLQRWTTSSPVYRPR